ncbi:MAG: hypothetical protein KF724_08895 [Phycisphaeraceae bacterium]|nr:hypothetical protein [Phycisphaeraceae bacterium]
MTACLAIVAGAVLFGVFGPGIAQRSMLTGGTSLGELVNSAVIQRDGLLWRALNGGRGNGSERSGERTAPSESSGDSTQAPQRESSGDSSQAPSRESSRDSSQAPPRDSSRDSSQAPPRTRDGVSNAGRSPDEPPGSSETLDDAAARAMARLIGHGAEPPDLSPAGLELAAWSTTSLAGGRDDAVALGYLDQRRDRFLALFALIDDGRFILFDAFGRAVPLLPDRLVIEEVAGASIDNAVVMVWSTGPVLWIAVVDAVEDAMSLRPLLGAP